MWHTPQGERTLTKAEARLYRETMLGLFHLIDESEPDHPWTTGILLFDDMSRTQQMAMLEAVWTALTSPDVRAPEPSALRESVLGAVLECYSAELIDEVQQYGDASKEKAMDEGRIPRKGIIKFDDTNQEAAALWQRSLLLAALKERGHRDLPDVRCADVDTWNNWLAEYYEVILDSYGSWDNERLLADYRSMRLLGLPTPAYFDFNPPDPSRIQMSSIRMTFGELIGQSNKDYEPTKIAARMKAKTALQRSSPKKKKDR